MKKALILLFLGLIATSTFAGKGLTLTQKYTTSTDGQSVTVTWYITETQCKLKMQFSDKDVNTTTYFIPDLKSNNLITYNDAAMPAGGQKAFFNVPVASIKSDIGPSTLQRTGETKEISGISCEKIVAKTGNSVTEMWVTKGFKADFYKFASFFKSSYELKALSDSQINGVPVSSVTKDNTGRVINSYELVSVSSSDIADTEFQVPAEYKSTEEISKGKK